MSRSDTLKLFPCEHGLEALDENIAPVITDAQIELDVVLPDGSKISGLSATMGQRDQSNDIYRIVPAAPVSAFVVGQQSLPFSFAWVGGKKPSFFDRGSEPWKITMTFQQELLDGKETPGLAKAVTQQQVRK